VEEIGTREVATEGEKQAMEYIRSQYMDMGYDPENGTLNEIAVDIAWGTNIEAIRPAKNEASRIVIIGGHYDSWVPGARDNASGAAAVLALARHFAQCDAYEEAEIRFVSFTAEETGHQGSLAYVAQLTQEERSRVIAMFNLDILAVESSSIDAFSCDSLGMRTRDGYVDGTVEEPAYNRAVLALLAAMEETGEFPEEEKDFSWCVPRHLDMSDHQSFHLGQMDAVNICFRGNVYDGGYWPVVMHTEDDVIDDFDLDRTQAALNAVIAAVDGLAQDPSYGER